MLNWRYWFSVTLSLTFKYICRSVTYILWYSDFALYFQYYLMNKPHSLDIGSDIGHWPVFHDYISLNHLPISAYGGVFKFDVKTFVNVARLEIGQLFTQGARQGHPCTLDTFLVFDRNSCEQTVFCGIWTGSAVPMSLSSSPELKAHWWAYRIGRPPSYLVVVRRRPHSLNISSETTGPVKVKFHMELLWDGETKVCSNGPGHMTKMADMLIYGKNFKNLLWNQKADDLESWCATSGARVLPSLLKWSPWVDLDLFYGKVKFGPLCFCMGKR